MAAILLSEARFLSIQGQLSALLRDKIPEGGLHATVIAHSAGTAVSLAVLTDPTLWDAWNGNDKTPESISFLTFGSSLNLAWRASGGHGIWEKQPLDDRVRWIDFWARYDPISHGPAIMSLKDTVRGTGGGVFENVRVVNNDDPFSDHSNYWGNHPEVVSRILYEAAQVKQETPSLWNAIHDALGDINRHRRHIGIVASIRALGGLAALAFLVFLDVFTAIDPVSSLGRQILEFILPEEQNGGGVRNWILQLQTSSFVHWLVGVGVFAVGLYFIWQIIRLWIINPMLTRRYRP